MNKNTKFINISNDYTSKDIFNIQNNYYKEDKNISHNPKKKSDIINKIIKGNSNSKNLYKVTYTNSILNNDNINGNRDFFQNLGNKNVLIINNKKSNSNSNIKQINYYNNKSNNNNITSHNFYNKKINEILSEGNNNINTINKSSINTNSNTGSNNNNYNKNSSNKSHSIIHNNSHKNINNKNHMNTNKSIKKNSSKKKNLKIIYANKRPSLPIGKKNKNKNKNKNNTIHNRSKSKKIVEKDNSSKSKLSKISIIKNRNKINTNNGGLLNSNYYSNYTYTNENDPNSNKNNLIPVNLKYNISSNKKNKNKKSQEIKKSQSQSNFKNRLNHDLNTSNYKYNTNNNFSKSKSNDKSYKGIIMDKKNMLKNNLIKSSSHNSTSKKNPIVCINYKNKYINNSNTKNDHNKININNNYNHFMNNLPEEYKKSPLFLEIKNLWNKLRVSYSYQEMFVTLTNQYDDKKPIFTHEIKSLTLIVNHLNKLNTDIKARNSIIGKLKKISINNYDEILKLLISLRMITIDVVNDYALFIKEISCDVLKSKFNLENIKNFDKNYINILRNDTKFLFSHNYLNKIFHFSDKSDPFLKYPSSSQTYNNDNKYMLLPLDEETLQKINECQYLLLTEKICDYSMCNNKTRVNYLLFSDQDNIINDLINENDNHIIKNDNYSNNVANSYSTNQNNGDISPFTTPNNKSQNSKINMNTINNTNKFEKFCYINNVNNSNTNENNKTEENNKKSEDDNVSNNENIINKVSSNTNNVETNENNMSKNESNKNNSIINNSNEFITSPIKGNLKINEGNNVDIPNENNDEDDIKIIPYIPLKDESLSSFFVFFIFNFCF